jgi:hypothetical protein
MMMLPVAFAILVNLLVRVALGGLLQYFLCSKNPKLGLILPILSLAVSVVYTLFLVCSVVVSDTVVWSILGIVASFVALNVPALVYYLIYRAAKKKARAADMDRMKIDDLE